MPDPLTYYDAVEVFIHLERGRDTFEGEASDIYDEAQRYALSVVKAAAQGGLVGQCVTLAELQPAGFTGTDS